MSKILGVIFLRDLSSGNGDLKIFEGQKLFMSKLQEFHLCWPAISIFQKSFGRLEQNGHGQVRQAATRQGLEGSKTATKQKFMAQSRRQFFGEHFLVCKLNTGTVL